MKDRLIKSLGDRSFSSDIGKAMEYDNKTFFETYEWVIILIYLKILGIGLYSGHKADWVLCDDPQVCDGTPLVPVE